MQTNNGKGVDPGTKERYQRATSGTVFTKVRDCSIDTNDIFICSDLGRGIGAYSKMYKEEFIQKLRSKNNKLTVLPPGLDNVTSPNRAAGLGWNGISIPAAILILIGGGAVTDLNVTQGWRYFLCYSPVDPLSIPIGYGAAVTSAATGEGWCAGIFSATKVAGSTKTFVAVYTRSPRSSPSSRCGMWSSAPLKAKQQAGRMRRLWLKCRQRLVKLLL